MTAEIKAISTTVSAAVTTLWQRPLKLHATSTFITVYPLDAKVDVTCGKLGAMQTIEVTNFGYIVKFSNSLTAQGQNTEEVTWTELYKYATMPDPTGKAITIKYDKGTGTFIASRPCYAALRIHLHKHKLGLYPYTPEVVTNGLAITVTYGIAYALLYYTRPGTTVAAQDVAPMFQDAEIPAPEAKVSDPSAYERYRVTAPTVVTPAGEFHMPKDFDKESYDPENAYGTGKPGPSKDEGWVKKDVVVEIGYTNSQGTTMTRSPLPKLLGSEVPVADLSLHNAGNPKEVAKDAKGNLPSYWTESASFVADRTAKYNETLATSGGGIKLKVVSSGGYPAAIDIVAPTIT